MSIYFDRQAFSSGTPPPRVSKAVHRLVASASRHRLPEMTKED